MDISELMGELPRHVNGDPVLRRIGRFCSTEFLLDVEGQEFHLIAERGELAPVIEGPLKMRPWVFAIRAPRPSWERFWQPLPEVGFNDLFAMTRHGHARIDGDVGPMLEHLRYIKEVVAMPRRILTGGAS